MQGSCQRRDLKRIFCSGHTSPVRRNRRGQINDVRARKFSARSASTRPSIVVPRGGTQPISAKAGVAGRKGLSLKYRVANVGHFTHLPVPAGIAPGKLSSLTSAPRSATSEPLSSAATSLHSPATTLPIRKAASASCRGSDVYFPCSTQTRRAPPSEKFRHNSPLPMLSWVSVRQSLGKRRQRAHRRRFARPPRF